MPALTALTATQLFTLVSQQGATGNIGAWSPNAVSTRWTTFTTNESTVAFAEATALLTNAGLDVGNLTNQQLFIAQQAMANAIAFKLCMSDHATRQFLPSGQDSGRQANDLAGTCKNAAMRAYYELGVALTDNPYFDYYKVATTAEIVGVQHVPSELGTYTG